MTRLGESSYEQGWLVVLPVDREAEAFDAFRDEGLHPRIVGRCVDGAAVVCVAQPSAATCRTAKRLESRRIWHGLVLLAPLLKLALDVARLWWTP